MSPEATAMIGFLRARILRDPSVELDEDTPLVSSGLVDSFALIDVLLELERVVRRRIPASRVTPADFETVRRMLEKAQAVGTQR